MKSELFDHAYSWFYKDRMAPHVFERFLTVYERSVNSEHGYIDFAVNHMMMDSHETVGFGNTKESILSKLLLV